MCNSVKCIKHGRNLLFSLMLGMKFFEVIFVNLVSLCTPAADNITLSRSSRKSIHMMFWNYSRAEEKTKEH